MMVLRDDDAGKSTHYAIMRIQVQTTAPAGQTGNSVNVYNSSSEGSKVLFWPLHSQRYMLMKILTHRYKFNKTKSVNNALYKLYHREYDLKTM